MEECSQTKEEHVVLQFNLEIIHNLEILFTNSEMILSSCHKHFLTRHQKTVAVKEVKVADD